MRLAGLVTVPILAVTLVAVGPAAEQQGPNDGGSKRLQQAQAQPKRPRQPQSAPKLHPKGKAGAPDPGEMPEGAIARLGDTRFIRTRLSVARLNGSRFISTRLAIAELIEGTSR